MTYLLSLNGHLLHTTPVSLLGLCISHKIFLWSMLSNKCCCAEYFCCELYVHWSNELWNTSGMLLLLILHTVCIYSNEDMCNVCHCCHFFLSLHIISYTLVCMVCILYSGFFSSLSLVVKWSICCRFSMCQLKWNAFGMLLLTLIVHIYFFINSDEDMSQITIVVKKNLIACIFVCPCFRGVYSIQQACPNRHLSICHTTNCQSYGAANVVFV